MGEDKNVTLRDICGDDVEFELSEFYDANTAFSYQLDISGTGVMYDYDQPNKCPWNEWNTLIYKVHISEGIQRIGNKAFACLFFLENVEFPLSLKSIGYKAFLGTSIRKLVIPDNITKIDGSAFWSCGELKEVTIGNGISEINIYTFKKCTSLEYVTLGKTVSAIRKEAFGDCKKIRSFTCLNEIPPVVEADALPKQKQLFILYVPSKSISAYLQHEIWGKYEIQPID